MIQTIQGDATSPRPVAGEAAVIAHICNDVGAWGAGFVLAINDLAMLPRQRYHHLAKAYGAEKGSLETIPRGVVQFVPVERPDVAGKLYVANMVAQMGLDKSEVSNGCLVDYDALRICLDQLFTFAKNNGCNVHFPKGIGSGLAGGDQNTIIGMITNAATGFTGDVTLWEFVDEAAASFVRAVADMDAGAGTVRPAGARPQPGDSLANQMDDLADLGG